MSAPILAGVYPPLERTKTDGRAPLVFPFTEDGLVPTHLGRGAVWLALKALGLGAGKRIAMPAYHCGSEVEAAHLAGLEIDFYRVDGSLRVDRDDLERAAAACDATYLISNFGFPMPGLPEGGGVVVEDAAHALFSSEGEAPIGSRGDASVFCPRKSLGVPDGGAVLVKTGTEGSGSERPRASGRAMARSTLSLIAGQAALARLGLVRRFALRLLAGASRERAAAIEGNLTEVVIGEWDLDVATMEAAARRPTRMTERIMRRADAAQISERRRRNYEFLLAELGEVVPEPHREIAGVTPLYLPVIAKDRPRAMVALLEGGVRALEVWPVPHPLLDRERFAELEPMRKGLVALPVHQALRPEHMEAVLGAAKRALA